MSPSNNPTSIPSTLTNSPTSDPTTDPTNNPTNDPANNPTNDPTNHPTNDPTNHPTYHPTLYPTSIPTIHPSDQPTLQPTNNPTSHPTVRPTTNPTNNPTHIPTLTPTNNPSQTPTKNPSQIPTNTPSEIPSNKPSTPPTNTPTSTPTNNPSKTQTISPTDNPSNFQTLQPSRTPTDNPSNFQTLQPSRIPTNNPTSIPTDNPSMTSTNNPTKYHYRSVSKFSKYDTAKGRMMWSLIWVCSCLLFFGVIAFLLYDITGSNKNKSNAVKDNKNAHDGHYRVPTAEPNDVDLNMHFNDNSNIEFAEVTGQQLVQDTIFEEKEIDENINNNHGYFIGQRLSVQHDTVSTRGTVVVIHNDWIFLKYDNYLKGVVKLHMVNDSYKLHTATVSSTYLNNMTNISSIISSDTKTEPSCQFDNEHIEMSTDALGSIEQKYNHSNDVPTRIEKPSMQPNIMEKISGAYFRAKKSEPSSSGLTTNSNTLQTYSYSHVSESAKVL
eukprot:412090_1